MKHKILGFFIGLALVCLMLFTPISVNAADPIVTNSTSTSTVTTNTNSKSTVRTNPPSAISPSINASNSDLCMVGVSGAVQTQILGISTGQACPVLIPSICVCTAPLTPTIHKSLLLALMLGLIALGGLVLTVLLLFVFVVTVLVLVLLVTIGSAAFTLIGVNNIKQTKAKPIKKPSILCFISQRLNLQMLGLLHQ